MKELKLIRLPLGIFGEEASEVIEEVVSAEEMGENAPQVAEAVEDAGCSEEDKAENDRRYQQMREEAEKLRARLGLVSAIAQQMGVPQDDTQGILEALSRQNHQYKQAKEQNRARAKQCAQLLREENLHRAAENLHGLARQALELSESYAAADIMTELKNKSFSAMLKAGVPVSAAYEALHIEEIKEQIAKTAAEKAVAQAIQGIRARGMRVRENGIESQNGITTKTDMSKLSREERLLLAARAAMGEKIPL